MMKRFISSTSKTRALFTATLLVCGATAASSDTALGAPRGLPEQPLDLELRDAEIGNVYRVLGEVAHRDVVLDPCVSGKVDLKLKNVPVPVVFDILATQLRLHYEERGGVIIVKCGSDAASVDPRLDARVSIVEVDAPTAEALNRLAAKLKLTGFVFEGPPGGVVQLAPLPTVTLRLENVRLSTALRALSDETGLDLRIEGNKLVNVWP
jgi:type II secretory pathway component HofQ